MVEDHMGDPAQAFEDLRAEVSILRRAIEALPASIRENRPADYSADLAVLGKGLDEIGEQLGTILKSPALMVSPREQGHAIAQAGEHLVRNAAEKLNLAAHAAERQGTQLAGIIGHAWAKDRQDKHLFWTACAAFAVGLVFSPMIASALPFGLNTRVSALVMRDNRWNAGAALMERGNPQGWARLSADTGLVRDNAEAIDACRAAAVKTGKPQRCALTVKPPAPATPAPARK